MANLSSKKRMRNALLTCVGLFSLLVVRIGYIQFIEGEELQTLAYVQQTLDRQINPNRGTIYDRNGVILAKSASVETFVTEYPMPEIHEAFDYNAFLQNYFTQNASVE